MDETALPTSLLGDSTVPSVNPMGAPNVTPFLRFKSVSISEQQVGLFAPIWGGELEVVAVSSARDWVKVSLRQARLG